jgi:hypothetical protein
VLWRAAARSRFSEFIDHSLDTGLALVAVVTNDTHMRTLPRRIPAALS